MAGFSDDFKQRVREASDLVQIVEQSGVKLRRVGSNWTGLCPFHNEKTPSFHVSPDRGFFHCFGCGEGGDVFAYVMKQQGLTFVEALEQLAGAAGIPMERVDRQQILVQKKESTKKDGLHRCCGKAGEYFVQCLWAPGGEKALAYIRGRGFTDQTIRDWQLGWSPDEPNGLIDFLIKNSKTPDARGKVMEYALEAGVLSRSQESGRVYNPFRGRFMFPILDLQRRFIGFGGRTLDPEDKRKYVNSAEGPLFPKRKTLFGLPQAAKEIRLQHSVVLVEGYTDVIMCHQSGICNVVGVLGTAFTDEHIQALRRILGPNGRVTAFFDTDAAGQKATRRAIEMCMALGVPLSVAGDLALKDACDFIPKYGPQEYRNRIEQAQSSVVWLINRMIVPARDERDEIALARAVNDVMQTVNSCPDPVQQALYRTRVAEAAGVPESALPRARSTANAGPKGRAYPAPQRHAPAVQPASAEQRRKRTSAQSEMRLLRFMLENREWCARVVEARPPDAWTDGTLAHLAADIASLWEQDQRPNITALLSALPDADQTKRLSVLAFDDGILRSQSELDQILGWLQRNETARSIDLLRKDLERATAAGNTELEEQLLGEILRLQKERKTGQTAAAKKE